MAQLSAINSYITKNILCFFDMQPRVAHLNWVQQEFWE